MATIYYTQVLQDQNTTKACDIWALGCILFSLLTGRTPFQSASEYLTFQCILHHCDGSEPLQYPETIPPLARDLIGALLQPVPSVRLGAGGGGNGSAALKNHPFFTVKNIEQNIL
jgi:serine/threonine protein kinase